MKQPSITIAPCEETSAGFDPECISIQSFNTQAEAKAFIKNETDTKGESVSGKKN